MGKRANRPMRNAFACIMSKKFKYLVFSVNFIISDQVQFRKLFWSGMQSVFFGFLSGDTQSEQAFKISEIFPIKISSAIVWQWAHGFLYKLFLTLKLENKVIKLQKFFDPNFGSKFRLWKLQNKVSHFVVIFRIILKSFLKLFQNRIVTWWIPQNISCNSRYLVDINFLV